MASLEGTPLTFGGIGPNPRVSVVMTVLNGEAFLRPALDSVFQQTFDNFEMIVIDNASSDGTAAILDSYRDARMVRLVNERILTMTHSLNKGLDAARGTYVARLDADDVAAPERLLRQVQYLDAHPDVLVVGTHARHIDDTGKVIGAFEPPTDPEQLYDSLAYSNPFVHSACMFRLDAVRALGGYPTAFDLYQDFALWLTLARHGKLGMVDMPLVDLRLHRAQASWSPAYGFRRQLESIATFREAQRLPGLSAGARRRGRARLAQLHYGYARDLVEAGQKLSAGIELWRAFATAPIYCLARAAERLVDRSRAGGVRVAR